MPDQDPAAIEPPAQTEIRIAAQFQHPHGAQTDIRIVVLGSVLANEAAQVLLDHYGGGNVSGDLPPLDVPNPGKGELRDA